MHNILGETRIRAGLTLQTDVLVDGRAVEGVNERLLLFPSARVHLEVASDEELAGHVGYDMLREVVGEVNGGKNQGKRRFEWVETGTEVDRLDSRTIVDSRSQRRRDPSRHQVILSYLWRSVSRRSATRQLEVVGP